MSVLETISRGASKLFSALGKEQEVLKDLDSDVRATIARLQREDPGLKEMLENAHAYAVFPSVGKATALIGGAFGKGEVFEKGNLVGYAAVAQLTLGVQIGGQTFSQVIVFENKQALERFKQGKMHFAANASAVLVKAGAATTAKYEAGVAVFVYAEGGMMLEAAIGAQKFFYRPAAMGRTKSAPTSASKSKSVKKPRSRGKRPSRSQPGRRTRERTSSTSKSRGTRGRAAKPSARRRSTSRAR